MIAVVVPTIREDSLKEWLLKWNDLLRKHNVFLVIIHDGDDQWVEMRHEGTAKCVTREVALEEIPEEYHELFPKKSPACRNLGFWIAIQNKADVIMTFDDDTRPYGDPIQDHLNILGTRSSISWMNTADMPMRGLPYGIREEAEVKVSHGVWYGVPDLDACSQLVNGPHHQVRFHKMVVPRGIYIPFCGMNVAFLKEATPLMFWAPVAEFKGAERFDDIWLGVHLVDDLSIRDWAMATGYASVVHERASNPFVNLQREAVGISINEWLWNTPWKSLEKCENYGDFFQMYHRRKDKWEKYFLQLVS